MSKIFDHLDEVLGYARNVVRFIVRFSELLVLAAVFETAARATEYPLLDLLAILLSLTVSTYAAVKTGE